jgi:hypothetical protein
MSTFSNKWNKASLMRIWAPKSSDLESHNKNILGHHIVLVRAKPESCSFNSLDSLGKNSLTDVVSDCCSKFSMQVGTEMIWKTCHIVPMVHAVHNANNNKHLSCNDQTYKAQE